MTSPAIIVVYIIFTFHNDNDNSDDNDDFNVDNSDETCAAWPKPLGVEGEGTLKREMGHAAELHTCGAHMAE